MGRDYDGSDEKENEQQMNNNLPGEGNLSQPSDTTGSWFPGIDDVGEKGSIPSGFGAAADSLAFGTFLTCVVLGAAFGADSARRGIGRGKGPLPAGTECLEAPGAMTAGRQQTPRRTIEF